ncbi:MAG: DUF3089 domain-containing protein [Micropepsaceae bacterium]
MRTRTAALFIVIVMAGEPARAADFKTPERSFAETPAPPAPDYAKAETWVVWPGRPSPADGVPQGIKGSVAQNPKADVFFIHPTTYLSNATWNARFDEGGSTGAQLESGVLRYQLAIFNGCCRMFAPRYRQTTISAFLKPEADSFAAYDLAYSDVLRAFDRYIEQENKGRPFILASHSQGSLHATRLLQERIIARADLRKRLIAAYIVGASLPEAMEDTGLPPCNSARQTGCIVDWNSVTALTPLALGRGIMMTYGEGKYQTVGKRTWLCVNPLTWTRTGKAKPAANTGALPAVGHSAPLPMLISGVTGAKCARGRLVVSLPFKKREGFIDPLTKLGSYHNHDYNLFYASVRQNAIDRTEAFLNR